MGQIFEVAIAVRHGADGRADELEQRAGLLLEDLEGNGVVFEEVYEH